jgi:WS/DGAT/MGAT family acyltransferase
MTMPLDRSKPLWHTYMIDGYGEGAAMLSRMHHCIADGISLARVMLSLTDSEPDAGIAPPDDSDETPSTGLLADVAGSSAELVRGAVRLGGGIAKQGVSVATSPGHAARLAGAIGRDASTMVRLLLTPNDAATAIKGDPGISRRVAWTPPVPLERVKQIARANDATVNDVLLAAVTGALRHYLQERGSDIGEIQAMVPFNLRPLDEPVPRRLGNKFGLVFLPLPVGTSGSYRRLVEVHKRMEELKSGREGAVTYGLLSVTGMTPEPLERRIIDLFTGKGTAIMTNVPGPPEPVYVAGTPIRTCLFWAPTSGHIGMSVSIFSYRGEVTVGLMVDAALVPDPDEIVTQLERELYALGQLELGRRRHPPRRHRGEGAAHTPTDKGRSSA